MTPPEPEGGKAHDDALTRKLREATERNHARAEERRLAGVSQNQLVERVVSKLEAEARAKAALPVVERIKAEEGDPTPVATTIRSALVPKHFANVSLDSYVPRSAVQARAKREVVRWVDRAKAGEPAMLALVGATEMGKSHLLYAAVNTLLASGYGLYARPWYRLADELRYGGSSPFAPSTRLEPSEVRDMLWKHLIVCIDEVRPTASTAFDDTELAKYACHAYDQDLAVMITTNVSPLADVLGPPAARRFGQVVLDAPIVLPVE